MEFTGERFVPQLDGEIKYEHLHRYALTLDFVAGRSVLDIASGEGYGSALLAKRAANVIGVDIDPDSIAHAQSQYCDVPNLKFLVGSCSEIPVADASIDVIVSFETIEHHDQHEEMMQEFKRILKLDGCLIISSPNRLVYSDEYQRSNPFHVKELYYEEFADLMKRYFQQVQIYGQQLAVGSWVISLGTPHEKAVKAYSGDISNLSNNLSAFPSPVYFVAVCSDLTDTLGTVESVYIDTPDDLLRQLYDARNLKQLEVFQAQQDYYQLQNEFHQAQNKFHQTQNELHQAQNQVRELIQSEQDYKNKLQYSEELVKAMESSKFWKLRQIWMRFKQLLTKR
ncbi:MAG: hypothetical protein C4288_08475 [Leptolyngbya sp. ERB_1_1]